MNLFSEIVVDNFAGGGGASTGIKMAIGRDVDVAINHDPAAIAMHRANHPLTEHYCESVWDIDPLTVTGGRPVALCWFSPDCKHFSKAKGGKPVDKNIRGLAWVALRWAATVKPRVIMLENVEEFKTWGPLKNNYPDPKQKGRTFNCFVNALKRHGYKVDWRELRACDYGAPTVRKRFFLIARCDGRPILWPEPTHGEPENNKVKAGILKPYKTAAECIDWSLPCKSIFERKKPLAENTMRRIAKGLQKFVIDNPHPFIVQVNHSGENFRGAELKKPFPTVTAKHGFGLVMPYITQYHGEQSAKEVRGQIIDKPLLTADASNRYGLVAAHIVKHYGGNYKGSGADIEKPAPTITTVDHNALVVSNLIQMNKSSEQALSKPFNTVTAGGGHFAEVRAFLMKYYGQGEGQRLEEPLHTITTKDRFGLITVAGCDYRIIDIGMRMLTPRELFRAQGFSDDYIIAHDYAGNPYPKSAQVARCGNAVPPQLPAALVKANLPELCIKAQKIAV